MPIVPPVTFHRIHKRRAEALPDHAHDQAQLTFAASGLVQIRTGRGVWLLPPQLVAWIPPGASHRLDILSDADLWILLWSPPALDAWQPPGFPVKAFVSGVSPLMRGLLEALADTDVASERGELTLRLMLHELGTAKIAPTFLPMPDSDIGLRVAELVLADHRNELALETLASRAATSMRTASRRFPEETGMTLKAWRQRARILRTVAELGQGKPIAQVAREAGFASPAAFSHAFRQVMDRTPSELVPAS